MDQPTILIVSDNASFSGAVTARWQKEQIIPAFTLMSSDLCRNLGDDTFELAIVGDVTAKATALVTKSLIATKRPVLFVGDKNSSAQNFGVGIKVLVKNEGWLDSLVLISSEILQHIRAAKEVHRLQQTNTALERQAKLGSYMLDMHHTINNTLTSILGNSELVLLDADVMQPQVRSQLETIRNMSIRMHEILQRFSSLEKELKIVEKQALNQNRSQRTAAAGS